jgi:hypothetical protein
MLVLGKCLNLWPGERTASKSICHLTRVTKRWSFFKCELWFVMCCLSMSTVERKNTREHLLLKKCAVLSLGPDFPHLVLKHSNTLSWWWILMKTLIKLIELFATKCAEDIWVYLTIRLLSWPKYILVKCLTFNTCKEHFLGRKLNLWKLDNRELSTR